MDVHEQHFPFPLQGSLCTWVKCREELPIRDLYNILYKNKYKYILRHYITSLNLIVVLKQNSKDLSDHPIPLLFFEIPMRSMSMRTWLVMS